MHIADLIVRCAIEIESLSKELYWENGGIELYDENGKKREPFFDTDCIDFLNNSYFPHEKPQRSLAKYREDSHKMPQAAYLKALW